MITIDQQESWAWRVAVAFDMLGGITAGLPYDCTISTYVGLVRSGKETTKWKWERPVCVWLANRLDAIQAGHCASALQGDIDRAKATLAWLQGQAQDPT